MTPTVVASSPNAVSANAGSVAVANQASMARLDARICWISVSNTTITSAPSDWELLLTYTLATTRNGYIYRKPHLGLDEPSSHTFTFGAANNHSMVQCSVRDCDLGTWDFVPTNASAASGTPTTNGTGATTVRPDALLLASFHVLANTAGATFTSAMTNVLTQAGTGTAGHLVGLFSELFPTPGAISTRTATPSFGTGSPYGATMLAIPPRVIVPDEQSYVPRRRGANF